MYSVDYNFYFNIELLEFGMHYLALSILTIKFLYCSSVGVGIYRENLFK